MGHNYAPAYYSTLQDSIASLCKTILPFSFKKRRLPAAEHRLAQLQSDNLKWQQDSFHRMLHLMGLQKEGISSEGEVSAFRTHLLDTLIAAPAYLEPPIVLRDKLLFLQELFYAKCISVEEYHSSKRPLLHRLAAQGVEIDVKDVIVAGPKETEESSGEEWCDINLQDENCPNNKETLDPKNESKQNSAMKHIKGAISSLKPGKHKSEKSIFDRISPDMSSQSMENPFWDTQSNETRGETQSILMPESFPVNPSNGNDESSNGKHKRKPFRPVFRRVHNGPADSNENEGRETKSAKKQWGLDGLKKWKRTCSDKETAPFSASDGSCMEAYSSIGEGPDTKQIKMKLHSDGSPSDFFVDKVLGQNIKKELSRIQTELCNKNPNLKFSNEQIEAISTKLPVDKADLKNFFPRAWCDQYGDLVLNVVKKEFKDHVGEMEKLRSTAKDRHNSAPWTTSDHSCIENDQNHHPNLFSKKDCGYPQHQQGKSDRVQESYNKSFGENPFYNMRV
ncbi:hypothetical protein MLD38_014442 [Melastoma candidum]|uniref:Uncharacterized protein n=1 Tax=Melastoma candidum TaxID=119954 RepID=A0ACB9RC55_9MYRT|nr:hypothetical protein MLD38_014442 [Melastoma candidum]